MGFLHGLVAGDWVMLFYTTVHVVADFCAYLTIFWQHTMLTYSEKNWSIVYEVDVFMNKDLQEYMLCVANSDCPYDQYFALMFALQIPSICGRLDIPKSDENTGNDNVGRQCLYQKNGRPHDKNLYLAWLRQHPSIYRSWSSRELPFSKLPEAIYELRNRVFHEGVVFDGSSSVVLFDGNSGCLITSFGTYVSVKSFCRNIFDAVGSSESIFSQFDSHRAGWSRLESGVRILSKQDFDVLSALIESRYADFWSDRNDDLELWQAFYRSSVSSIDVVREKLNDDTSDNVYGLCYGDALRLVKLSDELDIVSEELRCEVKEYIEKLFR